MLEMTTLAAVVALTSNLFVAVAAAFVFIAASRGQAAHVPSVAEAPRLNTRAGQASRPTARRGSPDA